MHDNLDKWIKDAREVTPDSGEYRRLNRVLVKERILTRNPSRKRRHRALITAIVALIMIVFSGTVSQLGSNSFEFVKKTQVHPLGDSVTVYYDAFGTGSINLPTDMAEADVRAYKQSLAAKEGELFKVTGLSYGGKNSWHVHIRRVVKGVIWEEGRGSRDPVSEDLPNEMSFLTTHMKDLVRKTRTHAAHAETTITIEGHVVPLKAWTFEYPGYGKVTRYVGYPPGTK
jgi:hypothetical protein